MVPYRGKRHDFRHTPGHDNHQVIRAHEGQHELQSVQLCGQVKEPAKLFHLHLQHTTESEQLLALLTRH